MVCVPIPLSTTPDNVAFPPLRLEEAPLFSVVVVDPTVSVKVTEPVGMVVVCPDVVSDTVAVSVAGCPLTRDVGVIATVVDVVSPGLVPVPLTETCCVLPVTL